MQNSIGRPTNSSKGKHQVAMSNVIIECVSVDTLKETRFSRFVGATAWPATGTRHTVHRRACPRPPDPRGARSCPSKQERRLDGENHEDVVTRQVGGHICSQRQHFTVVGERLIRQGNPQERRPWQVILRIHRVQGVPVESARKSSSVLCLENQANMVMFCPIATAASGQRGRTYHVRTHPVPATHRDERTVGPYPTITTKKYQK